jgi:NAD-dependent dihydropyrimidine dehydrogenase PreA subunit
VSRRQSTEPLKRRVEAAVFVAVLALGWRWPLLAWCLVVNVAVGLVEAIRHGGRHGCGNFCPRGAFYSMLPDTGRKVPPGLLAKKVSIFVMVAMFAGLVAWLRPVSWREWGFLFWVAIVITTGIGVLGWLVFNRYFWCSVCPMGKIYKMILPGKSGIRVDATCVKCGLCAKACPFGFFPPGGAKDGVFRNADCLLCRRCAERCPKGALEVVEKQSQ